MNNNYISISNDRMKHMLGVARKAYKISKERGHDESFSRKMFLIGYLHDIGYEFSKYSNEHSDIGAELMQNLIDESIVNTIKYHGKYADPETEEWQILNMADMQISYSGEEVTVYDRLEDIKNRYGEFSNEYLTSCDICYRIGLTAYNFASYK